jgi:hypothetical protein
MAKRQLIIQFRWPSEAVPDFDALVRIEDILIQAYDQNGAAFVDGHDVGLGKLNYFLYPRGSWKHAIAVAQAHLRHHRLLDSATIAKRLENEEYVVVWPPNHSSGFDVL